PRDDPSDGLDIHRPPRPCPVEIDEVDTACPFRFPTRGHLRGIVAEDGLSVIIALAEPHAQPSAQVDRPDELHGSSPIPPRTFTDLTLSPATGCRKNRPTPAAPDPAGSRTHAEPRGRSAPGPASRP